MPYVKQTHTDEIPSGTPKFEIVDDVAGSIASSATIELITPVTAGTPLNASRLNYMEEGIETAQETAETAQATAVAAQASVDAKIPKSIVTSIGDIIYATGSALLARLAKPASDSVLKNTSDGTVQWLPINAIAGLLHAKAFVDFDAGNQSIAGTAFTDITNATVNIVTTRTCTIITHCSGVFASDGAIAVVRSNIGGVAQANGFSRTFGTTHVPYGFTHYRTGVPAGTITCKLQGQALTTASDHAIFGIGKIVVLAITE